MNTERADIGLPGQGKVRSAGNQPQKGLTDMNTVKRIILEKLSDGALSKQEAVEAFKALSEPAGKAVKPIAIVGIACRLPMSPDKEEYWDNLVNGRNCFISKPIEKLIEDRVFTNPHYAEFYDRVRHTEEMEDLERYVGPYLEDADKFDAQFFGITDAEADTMDPQHRIFLEQAWRALEDAGYSEDTIRGTRTGCFVGRDGTNSNFYRHMVGPESSYHGGIWEGILASRINYHFDLRGPSSVVDTACSSSLVAMQMAIHALNNDECTTAIAGGVALTCGAADNDDVDIDDLMVRNVSAGAVVAKDYRVRSFDGKAAGAVFGEGVSVVILKTLEAAERDGNHIYGVVSSIATNSDGASNGLTAPNPRAQGDLLVDAWERAGINGADVDYVETHGTGTPLGDPIEVLGLTNAFSRVTSKKQFCGIGSVKSNIGHTVGAAGIAGVIKVLLAMQNEVIPASLNFEEPNPHIDFPNSPVYVVDRNTPWPRRQDSPRYAGVSSFGFSGTNAHVVLSDYRPLDRPAATPSRPSIFTLSAKTRTAFLNYLEKYDKLFAAGTADSLEDITYTSSCGRGHYSHRLAIVASSVQELATKFAECSRSGWAANPARGIFVAEHRVVSDRNFQGVAGEIRESDLGDLNRETRQHIKDLQEATGLAAVSPARDVARSYVRGAAVDFTAIAPEGARLISLPTYPFDQRHHWGVPRQTEIKVEAPATGKRVDAPMITECIVEAGDLSVYQARVSIDSHWAIRDHVIMGHYFVAGTVQIELMTEALAHRFGTGSLHYENIMFLSPATAEPGAELTLQVIVRTEDGGASVEVLSRGAADEEWTLHVRATARPHTREAETQHRTLEEIVADPSLKPYVGSTSAEFGPTWHNLTSFWVSEDDPDLSYGLLELPEEYQDQLNSYPMHPGLLDNAVSMMPFLLYMKPNVYLPMMYSGLTIHQSLPARFYAQTKRLPSKGNDLMSFATKLISEDGTTIAEVEQFSMKRVSELNDFVSGSYFGLEWRETDTVTASGELPDQGDVLLIGGDSPVQAGLEARTSGRVFRISFGNERKVVSERHVQTEPTTDAVLWAFDRLGVSDPARVIDIDELAAARDQCTDAELSRTFGDGIHGFSALITALLQRTKRQIDFVVVVDHADQVTGNEPFIDAAHAAKLAMIKSLRHECPNFTFLPLDVDTRTSVDAVVEACLSSGDGRSFIALREGRRYRQQLIEISMEDYAPQSLALQDEGFYLITGGLGSLGSAMAAGLARSVDSQINLVLAGRTPLPPQDEWPAIMAGDPGSRLSQILDNISDAEGRGCKVEILIVDITDAAALSESLHEMRTKFGPLRGAVHAAGVIGDGFLFTKSMEDFDRVLAPKVEGLRNLVACSENGELDFLVSFSSMTALIGGPGQSDYTAANAFLDAFTLQLRKSGLNAKSINWPGWREIGMAHEAGLADRASFFDSLSTSSGVAAFNEISIRDVTGVVPGKLNAEVMAHVGMDFFPFGYSESLARGINRAGAGREVMAGSAAVPQVIEQISLTGKPLSEFSEIEKVVTYTYAVVLGLEEINIFDSFTSMGGNSLAATELMRGLNSSFGDVLNISDMFSYGTPDEMAARITELTAAEVPAAPPVTGTESTIQQMLAKLESGEVNAESVRAFMKG